MERFFNTAGPNIPSDNYTIAPLSRIDLDDVLLLIRQKRNFVLHAPRQTWIGKFDYAEACPQLLLQAFLQRIVNGGGYIDCEYGLGRKRTDLLIRMPLIDG